jgi:hypothetical protein
MIFNKVTLPNIVLKPGPADPGLEPGRPIRDWNRAGLKKKRGKKKPGVTWRSGKTRLQIR